MKQISLRLSSSLLDFMGAYANKKGISNNALMVSVLDEFKESHS